MEIFPLPTTRNGAHGEAAWSFPCYHDDIPGDGEDLPMPMDLSAYKVDLEISSGPHFRFLETRISHVLATHCRMLE